MDTKIDKQTHGRYCIVIYSIRLFNTQFYLINVFLVYRGVEQKQKNKEKLKIINSVVKIRKYRVRKTKQFNSSHQVSLRPKTCCQRLICSSIVFVTL
jgi:hydrogenase-4 membrane subunit HyfE